MTARTVEADLCIVGAGPAGISLAQEFVGAPLAVAVVESGGTAPDRFHQRLNDGIVIGDRYARLRDTRHRQAGGTAHLWNSPGPGGGAGAKYVPLDPSDFTASEGDELAGWPFGYSELEPFYMRAQRVCGLGAFKYDAADWSTDHRRPLRLDEFFTSKVYQFGDRDVFTQAQLDRICACDNVALYHDLAVDGFEAVNAEGDVGLARAVSRHGGRIDIRSRAFVLAAGAIENARLLLLSARGRRHAPGDHSGWLGRCLMEHPRDGGLWLIPRSPTFSTEATFYDAHQAAGGSMICGRIGINEEALRSTGLPNASITLRPLSRSRNRLGSMIAALARARGGGDQPEPYGWSRQTARDRASARYQLYLNIEQRPRRENRIVLSRARDALGIPLPEMQWRFTQEDGSALAMLRASIARHLEASGLGRVIAEPRAVDPNAHHHAGTTRMHADARWGVVDADLRIHGVANLFVAGSSVFPTAGYANPTLTIAALSLRLADHLKAHVL